MKRISETEITAKTVNVERAINKFFRKHPELEHWKETFQYMAENNVDFFCDNTMSDGTKNKSWTYALHLDINENSVYICVVERA